MAVDCCVGCCLGVEAAVREGANDSVVLFSGDATTLNTEDDDDDDRIGEATTVKDGFLLAIDAAAFEITDISVLSGKS